MGIRGLTVHDKKIILTYFEALHKVVTVEGNKRGKADEDEIEPEHYQAFVTRSIVKKAGQNDEAEQPEQENAGNGKRVVD